MRALCWNGANDLRVETVPDPKIVNPRDVILRVTMSTTCGSDLHLIDGYIPTMRAGDIMGHEFMGEIVETGSEVKKVKKGQRVVVPSFICCGHCFYCQNDLWSLCDNTNPNHEMQEPLFGYPTAGIYGYTHAFGGYAGSHAQYIRVPHADVDCFPVPDGITDEQAVFLSDAGPTGFMGADLCSIQPGDNTPQFDWSKSRLPNRAQPVPPIYQPEVAAEAVVFASKHRRREIYVGLPTVIAIVGNKLLPGLGDWYLGKTGYKGQQTAEKENSDRPDNLHEPVEGDRGAHGRFDNRASGSSSLLWTDLHRKWVTGAVLLAAGAAAATALAERRYRK